MRVNKAEDRLIARIDRERARSKRKLDYLIERELKRQARKAAKATNG